MAAAALAIGLAGYQIISGFQQAELVGRQMELQRQIDEENAKLAEYDAWRAEAYGQTLMAEYQQQIDQVQAKARVSAAAEGVSTAEGSIAEVMQQNEIVGLANRMAIEASAREKALGYTRQARNIRTGSQMNQATAKAQQSSIIAGSILSAGGSLVKGLASSGGSTKVGTESGYSLPSLEKTPGSYLTGSSEDLGSTGYLGLP